MSNLSAEDVQRYIESQYLTEKALAARAEVTPEHLRQLLYLYESRADSRD